MIQYRKHKLSRRGQIKYNSINYPVLSFFLRKEDHGHARTSSPSLPIRAADSSNQEGKAANSSISVWANKYSIT